MSFIFAERASGKSKCHQCSEKIKKGTIIFAIRVKSRLVKEIFCPKCVMKAYRQKVK